MYAIEFTQEAADDVKAFKKFEQRVILSGIETQLRYEPMVETRNRKRLRPNDVADWELRVGKYRILYNIEEHLLNGENIMLIVSIEAIGFKVGNMLFIRGKRREL
jgi:mRNA-degrading endonuclease RelE of RelBE toxin-antitoxin system